MSVFDLNEIIDKTNDSIKSVLQPLSKDIQINFDIVNKLNHFIEELPKYKQLFDEHQCMLSKYNSLLDENTNLKQKVFNHEKYIKLLLEKNIHLNKINIQINKIINNKLNSNYGYWYHDSNYEDNESNQHINNDSTIKLLIEERENIKDEQEIKTLYLTYGIYLMNQLNEKQKIISESKISNDLDKSIKHIETSENESKNEKEEEDGEDEEEEEEEEE